MGLGDSLAPKGENKMSAYIVENKTINRIISYMQNDREAAYINRELGEISQSPRHFPKELGLAMFDMNCQAVNTRYEDASSKFNPPDYEWNFVVPENKFQVLKSLRCYLYQCNEGAVPEMPLFQILDDYAHDLAYSLVTNLPQYEVCEWA